MKVAICGRCGAMFDQSKFAIECRVCRSPDRNWQVVDMIAMPPEVGEELRKMADKLERAGKELLRKMADKLGRAGKELLS
jgi:hypothetical protein